MHHGPSQEVIERSELFVTPARCEPKFITSVLQGFFKVMSEKLDPVSTQVAGITDIVSNPNVAKTYAFMRAGGFLDVHLGRPFGIIIAKFPVADIHLPKRQKVVKSQLRPKK